MAENEPNKPNSVKTPVKKQTASIQATEVVSNATAHRFFYFQLSKNNFLAI
ncbi:hypothetical protein [Bacillus sp. SD088]|uniref:hypothetical protein n=1 Tax=Bacillus sp. SD088 TaxID=2782012 RepID=UPI001A966D04|nr:hypothetical protein [Bacillus sp. SD088]MBO0994407.1 hypothetical protein [Bacillus sp. SD088]